MKILIKVSPLGATNKLFGARLRATDGEKVFIKKYEYNKSYKENCIKAGRELLKRVYKDYKKRLLYAEHFEDSFFMLFSLFKRKKGGE